MSSNLRLPLAHGAARESATSISLVAADDSDSERSVETVENGELSGVDEEDGLMQIGDRARESGKTVRALHLYEELDLLRPTARSKGRYRLYGPEALTRVRWIGKLQDIGFSLADIQGVVRDWERSPSAPRAMDKMRAVYQKKLVETRAHLAHLAALEGEILASLRYLDACEACEPLPEQLLHTTCTACDKHGCGEIAPELVAGFHAVAS